MKTIGKYIVQGLLGAGGMGRVYKVRQPHTEQVVALKLLAPREEMVMLLGMDELSRRFLAEARTMARLKHPNIARVWDLDFHQGAPFFTMELYCLNLGVLLGETYEDAQVRSLSIDTAVHVAAQTLEALGRLHHAGMVHRDVKPVNIMLTQDIRVKLIDFGLSKLRGEVESAPQGLKIGSPFFTAPEQERDPDNADHRADLFSVGLLLHRMLTGRLPDENAPPSTLNPALEPAWDDFLARAAHPDPDERFRSAEAMRCDLDRLDQAWSQAKQQACYLLEETEPKPTGDIPKPRSAPVKVLPGQAQAVFPVDELWRPAEYAANDFQERGETVADLAAGLAWERSGARYPANWAEAQARVDRLNQENFASAANWRLPTIDELLTLFRSASMPGDFCLESPFDAAQARLWSADRKSFAAAWFADASQGYVAAHDMSCAFHSRAVRDLD
ncbi:MAG: protein kinase domain-containing protein [Desulfovibrionaceae bacterium]